MGSTHRAHLIASGGGQKLHEAEADQYKNDLNDFMLSHGAPDDQRTAAIAQFDMGYDNGYRGERPFFSDEWDEPGYGDE